jgi:hypothetical protein
MTSFVIPLTFVCMLAPVLKDQETIIPSEPPPWFQVVSMNEKGDQLLVRVAEMVPVTKVVLVQVMKGNEVVTETRNVTEYQTVVKMVAREAKGIRAFQANGKEIEADRLRGLLRKETIVLVSPSGKEVHESYRKMLRDDVIILVFPK